MQPFNSRTLGLVYFIAYYAGKVDLHPVYQRALRWGADKCNEFIKNTFDHMIVPELMFYTLQSSDKRKKPTHTHEAVDGQHRFMTWLYYIRGEYITLGRGKRHLIYIPEKRGATDVCVFYKETPNTQEFARRNPDKVVEYLSDEEREHFDNYPVQIRFITGPMTLKERQAMFVILQSGIPVRNADLLKNYTDIPLIQYMQDENCETRFKHRMLKHLGKNPTNYWLHWLIRMEQMVVFGSSRAMELADSHIAKFLNGDDKERLVCSEEQFRGFITYTDKFFNYMDELYSSNGTLQGCMPYVYYALFSAMIRNGDEWMKLHKNGVCDVIRKHRRKDINMKPSTKDVKLRLDEFVAVEIVIADMPEDSEYPVPETYHKGAINPHVKRETWNWWWGEEEERALCWCCLKRPISKSSFHAGHVVAQVKGGATSPDNLRPICGKCNKSMGVENMVDYCRRVFHRELDPVKKA